MPARLEVHAIANERVFGIWRDDQDIEHVRVYVLRPTIAGV
jgi:hypothetical protein